MAQFSLSPSVEIKEGDATSIVPSVATSIGATAGTFIWGPANKRINVDSELTLSKIFGVPKAENRADWYSAANYLAYSNYLKLVRVVSSAAKNAVAASTGILVKNDDDFFNTDITYLAANKWIAKYAGELGNGLEVSFADADTFASWKYRSTFSAASSANTSYKNNGFTGVGFTGVFVSGASTVTVPSISDLEVGMTVKGTGIATGAVISELTNSTTITLSIACTASSTGLGNQLLYNIWTDVASGANGATTLTSIVSTTGWKAGDVIAATGLTAGTRILSIIGPTSITISLPTIAIMTTQAITVTSNKVLTTWSGAPGTSEYVATRGGSNDELHVVVVDKSGEFSGTKGTILEKWVGLSKASDAKKSDGTQSFYREVLNRGSNYVYNTAHETLVAGSKGGSAAMGAISSSAFGSLSVATTLSFTGGLTGNSTITSADRTTGFFLFRDAETVDVTLVFAGSLATQADAEIVGDYLVDNIGEYRKDCVVFISPPLSAVVNNSGNEERDIIAFRNTINSSSYAVMDTGWKYQYDRYNDTYVWVALNADIAGLCASVDNVADTWWSPAGFNRGYIKNVVKLAWNPNNKPSRDNLYQIGINPIVTFAGLGTVMYGDKTLQSKPSAFDRINVRRLFILLEKAIATFSKFVLFEFNDAVTQARFNNTVTPYLRDIKGRRGIIDFKVITDSSVNTPEVVDSNGFVAKFLIKPSRSINFITLNFVATPTGINFDEVF